MCFLPTSQQIAKFEPMQKKRRRNLYFGVDQKPELVEWLKNHPIFYNKASKNLKSVFGWKKHMDSMYLVLILRQSCLSQIDYGILVNFVVTGLLVF